MIFYIFIFILGLVFGSFVSALTWRYPKNISIVKGRSICPKCRKQINWFDNIPLISFLILGGKCRNCKRTISLRYPIIELATALGFIVISLIFKGVTLQGIYSIVIFLILETIFITDIEEKIIPDDFVFFGITISVLYFLVGDYTSLPLRFLAGLASSFFLLLIHLITGGRGMGLGDVKFAVLAGMITGPKLFLIWLFLAFLTGGATGSILILGKKAGLKSQIAFGPFLVLAIPLTLVYGEKILLWLHF